MNEQITIIDDEGIVRNCTILFTFDYNNQTYVLYYEEDDPDGEVYAKIYVPAKNGEEEALLDIETKEEWDIVEEMFESFMAEEVLATEEDILDEE